MKLENFVNQIQKNRRLRDRNRYRRSKKAGVLIPFVFDGKQEPYMLLTKRTEELSTHRGEVAFPGGMMDPTDRSIIETALREAEEEIGLDRHRVKVIGQVDDLISTNTELMVTPSIGVITDPPSSWKINSHEVAKVFEVPFSALFDSDRWRVSFKEWRGKPFKLYFFDYDGETLWGLSAYATLLALDLTEAGPPLSLDMYYKQIKEAKFLVDG